MVITTIYYYNNTKHKSSTISYGLQLVIPATHYMKVRSVKVGSISNDDGDSSENDIILKKMDLRFFKLHRNNPNSL